MASPNETIYRADWTFIDGQFEADVALVVQDEDIADVLRGDAIERRVDARSRIVDLGDVALIPGQLNVHSHAFQRALRGKTEYRRSADESDDFWTWRTEMYRLANRVTADDMEVIARMAFLEMARCGITHVGEFHYVHHRPDGTAYDDRLELAARIGAAADDVGIRLTMLPVAYHTGGIEQPPSDDQRRFIYGDVADYLEAVDGLSQRWDDRDRCDVGLAPHSIRAAPRRWLEAIADAGTQHEMPVHIHVCEQPAEVEQSRQAFGMPPVEALHDWGVVDETWTLIHATHLSDREFEILEQTRPTVGACPTTERNLGDGFLPARKLVRRDVPIALGSDSHTVIDPFEEMRLVEYHERLRHQERNTLVGADARQRTETAEILWPMGTTHGARSLQSNDGAIRRGGPADFVAVDLDHPSIAGATGDTLLTDIIASMSTGAVRDVIVDGEPVVVERHHQREHQIVSEYRALMEQYAS